MLSASDIFQQALKSGDWSALATDKLAWLSRRRVVVTDADLGRQVLRDERLFSSDFTALSKRGALARSATCRAAVQDALRGVSVVPTLTLAAGETHKRTRRLLNGFLSATGERRLRLWAREAALHSTELWRSRRPDEPVEFDATAVGFAIPLAVAKRMLGLDEVPYGPWSDLVRRCHTFLRNEASDDEFVAAALGVAEFWQLIHTQWEGPIERGDSSRDESFLGYLARDQSSVESKDEVASMALNVVIGATETTPRALASTLDQMALADIDLDAFGASSRMSDLLERTLYQRTPTGGILRIATSDSSLGGHPVPQGTTLVVAVESIHQAHPPRESTLTAEPRGSLTFGSGQHRCPGRSLVRYEAEAVVAQAIADFRELRRSESEPPIWSENLLRGPVSLPLVGWRRAGR